MFRPQTHAHPAEVMTTSRTCHMVATLILLNRSLTARTVLGVGNHPSHIFRFRAVLRVPFLSHFTRAWSMSGQTTLKAETLPTFACNVFMSKISHSYSIVTAWSWTPLNILVVICEVLAMEFVIESKVGLIIFKHSAPHCVVNRQRALSLHTFGVNTSRTKFQLFFEVFVPAIFTKCMPAFHVVEALSL